MSPSRAPADCRRWHRLGAAWCAVAAAELVGQAVRGVLHPQHGDLVAFLTGARLVGSDPGCLYCPAAQAAAQTQVLGHVSDIGTNPYANPPAAAWLLQPLTRLPLEAAMAVFTGLSLVALVVAGLILARSLPEAWPRRQRILVSATAVTLLPAGDMLAYGQWTPFLLPAAAGAVWLARRGDRAGSGVLLSLLLVKPQLVWLLVPALLLAGARRSLAGFAVGAIAWLGTGLLITGPRAMVDWAHTVLAAHVGEVGKTAGLPGIAAAAGVGGSAAFVLGALLAVAAVALLWALRDRLHADLPLAIGLGLALSALGSPHVFGGDLVLLAVPLVTLAARAPGAAMLAAVGLGLAWLVDQQVAGGVPRVQTLAALAVAGWIASALAEPAGRATTSLAAAPRAALTRL